MEKQDFIIDREFETMIPPLSDDECRQLKANILRDGEIKHPIVTWNGVIVDGHHRYKILTEHPDINYSIEERQFANRAAAVAWICSNQLGRRNLSIVQKTALMGRKYQAESESHGDAERFQLSSCPQNEGMGGRNKTANRIAEELGVSHSTVQRAADFVQGLDAAEAVLPGITKQMMSGEIKPTQADVAAIAKAPPDERRTLAEQLQISKKLTDEQKAERARTRELNKSIEARYAEHIRTDKPKPTAWDMIKSFSADVDIAIDNMQDYLDNYPDMLSDGELKEKTQEIFSRLRTFMERAEERMAQSEN